MLQRRTGVTWLRLHRNKSQFNRRANAYGSTVLNMPIISVALFAGTTREMIIAGIDLLKCRQFIKMQSVMPSDE